MPQFLWAEACLNVMHTLKKCPHESLMEVTPEEAFSGVNPFVDYFRVFGSPAYTYIPSDMKTKLEPTSKIGVFLGYGDEHKGYRIFIPSERRTILCRDVIFYEFGYKMTSNILGIEVHPDVPKTSDKEEEKQSKDVISDDIKHDQSDEVIEDHEEYQVVAREFPMWIKILEKGLKDENKPKVSPHRRSS